MKVISELFQEHLVYGLLALLCLASGCGLLFRDRIRRWAVPPIEPEPIEHFHVDPIVIRGVFPRAPKATPVPPPGGSGVPAHEDGRAGL